MIVMPVQGEERQTIPQVVNVHRSVGSRAHQAVLKHRNFLVRRSLIR